MKNLRLIAARVIDEVTNGRSLQDTLPHALASLTDTRDRGLVQSLCYGVCRFYSRLDAILSCLLEKPLRAKDSDVHALLLIGLFQLMDTRIPAHAAVAETVNAVQELKKPWARGLVNAVLRHYLRQSEDIQQQLADDEEAHFAHPYWWIQMIRKAWPQQWQGILEANNAHPPFALRVNQRQFDREQYQSLLTAQELSANIIPHTQSGLIVDPAVPVESLPAFQEGSVTIQDGAAQLAAGLLDLQPGQRILDACAAPGGKFTHILEQEPRLQLAVAIEKDAKRSKVITENLQRLKLNQEAQVRIICQDANQVKQWWDGTPFDRILLDAPCSASGVIRRHPDIKLLRQPHDIRSLQQAQRDLLNALWPLLAPGGLLVYATCSIFPQENVDIISEFCAHHADAMEQPLNVEWGVPCEYGRQILPGMDEMDGFYYAVLLKNQ